MKEVERERREGGREGGSEWREEGSEGRERVKRERVVEGEGRELITTRGAGYACSYPA